MKKLLYDSNLMTGWKRHEKILTLVIHATTYMNLNSIMLSEKPDTKGYTLYNSNYKR